MNTIKLSEHTRKFLLNTLKTSEIQCSMNINGRQYLHANASVNGLSSGVCIVIDHGRCFVRANLSVDIGALFKKDEFIVVEPKVISINNEEYTDITDEILNGQLVFNCC